MSNFDANDNIMTSWQCKAFTWTITASIHFNAIPRSAECRRITKVFHDFFLFFFFKMTQIIDHMELIICQWNWRPLLIASMISMHFSLQFSRQTITEREKKINKLHQIVSILVLMFCHRNNSSYSIIARFLVSAHRWRWFIVCLN